MNINSRTANCTQLVSASELSFVPDSNNTPTAASLSTTMNLLSGRSAEHGRQYVQLVIILQLKMSLAGKESI